MTISSHERTKKPLRVAITFPGCHRRGGVERVVYESARWLRDRGHAVTVFAREWEAEGTEGIRFVRVSPAGRPGFLSGRRFFRDCSRLLDRRDFDAVTCHGCVSPLDGVHWAHSIHGAWLEEARRLRGRWSAAAWKQRLNPVHPVLLRLERRHFAKQRYRHVIALTEESARDLGRLYGVPRDDITTIAPGYSEADFHPRGAADKRNTLRRELGIVADDAVICFVANELLRKGFGELIEAASRLTERPPHLLVVGGTKPGAFTKRIQQLGLTERVHWLGRVDNERLTAVYAASDVFALPTQYEGWGLVIVEALACGVPVVTARPARAAIVIREGETGRVIEDPKDVGALTDALRSVFAAGRLDPDAVSASVAPWRWDAVLPRYEALLYEHAENDR